MALRPRTNIKDHFRETRLFNGRVIAAAVFSVLLILVIIVRMIYLQIANHELYTTLSEENRFVISAIPPNRGLIFDSNGILLAQNLPGYTLELVPERVENMDKTIAALQEIIPISEEDISRFKAQLSPYRRFKPIPLRTRLSDEEVARIAVRRHHFPGVDIAPRLIRHYPHGELTAHAVGYVGRINEKEEQKIDKSNYEGTNYIGKIGIEKFYEEVLHGHVGVQHLETNAQGRVLRVIEQVAPEPGLNLHLTLDTGLQKVIHDALGEENGAVVAINPQNGNVLAFVSTPSFDPNLFVTGIDFKTYDSLNNHPNKPLFNRALYGQYPPGSTVKPFYALAGLEMGINNGEEKIACRGWFSLPGDTHRYRDWKKKGHGPIDSHQAVVQSCDVFFYDLANKMGIERMYQFMSGFGFDQKTGIDIPGENTGLMPNSAWKKRVRKAPWYTGETVIAGIGQGYVLATPIQLAYATGALATYGTRMQPHIVGAIENASLEQKEILQPVLEDPVQMVKRENWQNVISAMTDVVHSWRGTAKRISKDVKYKIAGKTGTAQVFTVAQDDEYDEEKVAKKLRDHALFVAFAPVENPQIAVSIIVENGGHGGSTAAPIARKVMDYYLLPKLEIPAGGEEEQKAKPTPVQQTQKKPTLTIGEG